jgi:hypothetical protein
MSSFDVRPLFPFGFLTTNVMLKNEKEIMTNFFYNNMMMYIKIDLFFTFPSTMTNLSYNVNC